MKTILNPEETKDPHVSIPTILVENSNNLLNFLSENDIFYEKKFPLSVQISQFFCWFSELSPPKQLIFAVLVIQNLNSDYVNVSHGLISKRLSETYQQDSVRSRANDIDALSQIDVRDNTVELTTILVDLLPNVTQHFDTSQKETNLHDSYLNLIDKAFEQAAHKSSPALAVHHEAIFDDVLESPDGQLILLSLSTPMFTPKDKLWLTSRLKEHHQQVGAVPMAADTECSVSSGEESKVIMGMESTSNLTKLAYDLLDAFSISSDCDDSCTNNSEIRHFRSSSINTQCSFFPRTLHSCGMNRRHHSLVPSGSSLCVPPSMSNTSSGFISGSESMHHGLSQVGLTETPRGLVYGSRLTAPSPTSHSRLYPSSSSSFNPFQRQPVSPYTFHHSTDGQLKEGDETAFFSNENQSSGESLKSTSPTPCDLDLSVETDERRGLPRSVKNDVASIRGKPPQTSTNISPTSPYASSASSVPRLSITSHDPTPSTSAGTTSGSFFTFDENCKSATVSCCQLPLSADQRSPTGVFSENYASSWSPQPSLCSRRVDDVTKTVQSSYERNTFLQLELGMSYVPVWLKSLRLHKYVNLFQRLTYLEMFEITDEWLQRQHVTQGARNKILVSINNLAGRSHALRRLETCLSFCFSTNSPDQVSVLRACLIELRGIIQTPIPPFPISFTQSARQTRQTISSTSSSATGEPSTQPTTILDEEDEDDDLFILADVEGGGSASEDDFGDDEEEEFDPSTPNHLLCQCPFTNSETCLVDVTEIPAGDTPPQVDENSENEKKKNAIANERSQFTEGVCFNLHRTSDLPRVATSSPQPPPLQPLRLEKGTETFGNASEENLPDLILRCLLQGCKLLLSGSKENQDNYGAFMQLTVIALDHSSFTAKHKEQLLNWQRNLLETLGPAPPRRTYRNTRPSRRPGNFSSSTGLQHHQMNQQQLQHGGPSGGLPFRGVPRHSFVPRLPRFQNLNLPVFLQPPPHHHSASLSPIRQPSSASFSARSRSPQPFAVQSNVYQHTQSVQQGPCMQSVMCSGNCGGIFSGSSPNFLQPQPWAHPNRASSRDDYPHGYNPVLPKPTNRESICEGGCDGNGGSSAFHPWATTTTSQQGMNFRHASSYRVASMDSLPFNVEASGLKHQQQLSLASPGSMYLHHLSAGAGDRAEPHLDQMTATAAFQRNRMASYHGPMGEGNGCRGIGLAGYLSHQSSDEVSEFTSCCKQKQQLFPTFPGYTGGESDKHVSINIHPGVSRDSAAATAEINRNLDLLTQKVTKLAIEESDSSSE